MREAGRELDALVAEKVMGWTVTAPGWGNRIVTGPFKDCDCVSHCEAAEVPPYSTDIAAAWEVVEKLDALGFFVSVDRLLDKDGTRFWRADLCKLDAAGERFGDWFGDGETPALAICLAALKAVGHA